MRCTVCVLIYAQRYETTPCRWTPYCAGEVPGDELTVFEGQCWRCDVYDWIPDPAVGNGGEDEDHGAGGEADQSKKGKGRTSLKRGDKASKDKGKSKGGRVEKKGSKGKEKK